MATNFYKKTILEIIEERKTQCDDGRKILEQKGINFAVFKKRLYDLIIVSSDAKIDAYKLFNEFCLCVVSYGIMILKTDDMDVFINEYFKTSEMSIDGIRLKSKADDRL